MFFFCVFRFFRKDNAKRENVRNNHKEDPIWLNFWEKTCGHKNLAVSTCSKQEKPFPDMMSIETDFMQRTFFLPYITFLFLSKCLTETMGGGLFWLPFSLPQERKHHEIHGNGGWNTHDRLWQWKHGAGTHHTLAGQEADH